MHKAKPWLGNELEEEELFLPRLPVHYYKHDRLWIAKQLDSMPRQTWQALCDGYSKRYDQQINNHDLPEIRRVGFARFEANNWLRQKVKRYLTLQAKSKLTKSTKHK